MPRVAGVSHRYVDAGGLVMHVAEAGRGKPLVLVHGWPQNWYVWRHVIPRLSRRFRVICPDLRGFGWTEAPPGGYDKEQLATDLLNLLDVLGLDSVNLAGHDWGGFAGFLMCLRQPERFRRFMALNIIHPWIRPLGSTPADVRRIGYQVIFASGAGEWILRFQPERFRTALVSALIDRRAWADGALDVFVDSLRRPARAAASVQLYRTFLTRELPAITAGRYRAARLTVPTLMLFGADDRAVRSGLLDGYQDHADDMRLELVPGCGHFIVDEKPELVAARMLDFFAG
jgi:pimeloyl-ACP methyl ester carboxylesterase